MVPMKRQVSGTYTFFRRTHENLCVADTVDRDSSLNSRRSTFIRLIGFVVIYAGIPAVVNVKSEHIDVDFDQHQIVVRDPKGTHDRTTMLPVTLELSLQAQLQALKHLHERDLASGHGEVSLPYALAQKYPYAAKEWGWQFIFPSSNLSPDPHDGKMKTHHRHESVL